MGQWVPVESVNVVRDHDGLFSRVLRCLLERVVTCNKSQEGCELIYCVVKGGVPAVQCCPVFGARQSETAQPLRISRSCYCLAQKLLRMR